MFFSKFFGTHWRIVKLNKRVGIDKDDGGKSGTQMNRQPRVMQRIWYTNFMAISKCHNLGLTKQSDSTTQITTNIIIIGKNIFDPMLLKVEEKKNQI